MKVPSAFWGILGAFTEVFQGLFEGFVCSG